MQHLNWRRFRLPEPFESTLEQSVSVYEDNAWHILYVPTEEVFLRLFKRDSTWTTANFISPYKKC